MRVFGILAVVLCVMVDSAISATIYFDSQGGSTDYNNANNWTGSAMPPAGGTATISGTASTNQTVTLNSAVANVADYLYVGAGTGATVNFDINSGGSLTTNYLYFGSSSAANSTVNVYGTLNSTKTLRLGYGGVGSLVVSGGSVSTGSSMTSVGESGGTGTITVKNNAVAVFSTTYLHIGNRGNSVGALNIESGTVTGPAVNIGRGNGVSQQAYGYANISGGSLNAVTSFSVGTGAYGFGSVTQTAGTITAAYTDIGVAGGSGTVTMSGGALNMGAGSITIGKDSGSNGILEVNGSALVNQSTGRMFVGYSSGSGRLNIGGGTVSTSFIYLGGSVTTATGVVSITAGSLGASSSCSIGSYGAGTLTASGTGTLTSAGMISLGSYGGAGTLNVSDNALVTTSSNLYIGNANGNASATGSVKQTGGTVSVDNVYVGRYAGNTGSYEISNGVLTTTNLHLAYSTAAGSVTTGSFTMTGGTLNLGGDITSKYSDAGGTATTSVNLGGGLINSTNGWAATTAINLTGENGNVTINTGVNDVVLSGGLAGNGGLIKTGSGQLTIRGNTEYYNGDPGTIGLQTYLGDTVVKEGTAIIGSQRFAGMIAGNVVVESGAQVVFNSGGSVTEGTGRITQYDGSVSGAGVFVKQRAGTLTTTGNHTYTGDTLIEGVYIQSSSGSLLMDINNAGQDYSQIQQLLLGVDGEGNLNNTIRDGGQAYVTLNGAINLDLSGVTDASGSWKLLGESASSLAGHVTFGNSFKLALSDGIHEFAPTTSDVWDYTDARGNWQFTESTGALTLNVPEPATALMLLTGLIGLIAYAWRRRK